MSDGVEAKDPFFVTVRHEKDPLAIRAPASNDVGLWVVRHPARLAPGDWDGVDVPVASCLP